MMNHFYHSYNLETIVSTLEVLTDLDMPWVEKEVIDFKLASDLYDLGFCNKLCSIENGTKWEEYQTNKHTNDLLDIFYWIRSGESCENHNFMVGHGSMQEDAKDIECVYASKDQRGCWNMRTILCHSGVKCEHIFETEGTYWFKYCIKANSIHGKTMFQKDKDCQMAEDAYPKVKKIEHTYADEVRGEDGVKSILSLEEGRIDALSFGVTKEEWEELVSGKVKCIEGRKYANDGWSDAEIFYSLI